MSAISSYFRLLFSLKALKGFLLFLSALPFASFAARKRFWDAADDERLK